jgi:hypothetical protein
MPMDQRAETLIMINIALIVIDLNMIVAMIPMEEEIWSHLPPDGPLPPTTKKPYSLARRCMALMDIDRKHVKGIVDEAKSW